MHTRGEKASLRTGAVLGPLFGGFRDGKEVPLVCFLSLLATHLVPSGRACRKTVLAAACILPCVRERSLLATLSTRSGEGSLAFVEKRLTSS